jgi:5-methylthioribose kinase
MNPAVVDVENPRSLRAYLLRAGHIAPGEEFRVTLLSGGVSNKTVLLEHPPRRAWVLKQALPKLRVEVDWFSAPERIHREAIGLVLLRKLLGPGHIPALVFEDRRQHVLAMHAVGKPHKNWKQLLLAGQVEFDYVVEFARMLAHIHCQGWKQAERWKSELEDKTFFETLRVEPYYEFTAVQVPEAAEFMQQLATSARQANTTLVHGDYSPKNILIRRGRLVLLDHEVMHWGEPAFDVGFAMTHLLSKAHHLPAHRSQFAQAAALFWDSYVQQLQGVPWKKQVVSQSARHLMGCLLARVAGRSRLEYLSDAARRRQRMAVLRLIHERINSVDRVIKEFLRHIEQLERQHTPCSE